MSNTENLPNTKCVSIDPPILDIEQFIETFFTVEPPFLLFSLKVELRDKYWKVKGVDLVLKNKFVVEISKIFLRFYIHGYLGENIGTVKRIIALINHYRA